MYNWMRGEPIWQASFLTIYSILMGIAFILSFAFAAYFWKRQKYDMIEIWTALIIIVPSSILGARIWFGISSPDIFNSASTFFYFQGLSIHGGVMFATLAVVIYFWFRRHTIDVRTAFGIIIPNVLLGQAIGRWGNFSNHEVYGQIVSAESLQWLGDLRQHLFIDGAYRAPFFFYESIVNFGAWLVLAWVFLRKNSVRPGVTGALYFLYYGLIRIVMEPLRDPSDILYLGGTDPANALYIGATIQTSVVLAAVQISLGVTLGIWWQFFSKPFKKPILTLLPFALINYISMSTKKAYKRETYQYYNLIYDFYFWIKEYFKGNKYKFRKLPKKRRKFEVSIWVHGYKVPKLSKREINNQVSKIK